MSNLLVFPDPRKAREEASLWLAGLDRGLSDDERSNLRGWLKDPINNKAFLEMGRLWRGLDTIGVLSELFPLSPEVLNPTPRRSFSSVIVAAVAAACIAAVGTLFLAGHTPWSLISDTRMLPPVYSQSYRTAVGETRVVNLADGTQAMLNANTQMVVSYAPRVREVYLSYGEASFQVAHETWRPFNLYAGKRRMQAMGTTFNVRMLSQDNTELTVTGGQVRVVYESPYPANSPARLRDEIMHGETLVNAEEGALLEPGLQSVRKLATGEIETRLQWQKGLKPFPAP